MRRFGHKIWHVLLMTIALLVCAWTLLSGWGGYVDPHKWVLLSVAGLTYPAAIIAALVILVISLLTRGWKAAIIIAASLLLTFPALRVNVPINGSHSPSDSTKTFRLLTFNVIGFWSVHGNEDVSSSMRYILDSNADVVVLQEGTAGPEDFCEQPFILPMKGEIERKYPYHSHGYHDLVIMSRYPYTVLEDTTLRNGHNGRHFYGKAFDVKMPEGRQ